MHYLLIACDVFEESINNFKNQTPHTITPIYLKLEAHLEPGKLHQELQDIIDEAEGQPYDMILMAYGLCGNATNGIKARSIPIVIPRAHDCCTLFLGSIGRFLEHFGENLSAQWTSSSYLAKSNQGMYSANVEDTLSYFGLSEEYEELVKQYGEDNAQYLWETLHSKDQYNTKMFYISTGAPDDEMNIEKLKQTAKEEGKTFHLIAGNLGLIEGLFGEKWGDEYLFVSPGQRIVSTNDLDTVVTVEKLPKIEKKLQNL